MNLAQWSRVFSFLDREYDNGQTLTDRIVQARAYVDNHVYRADVVQTLPLDAPGGYLMVKAGDPNLYVGTGTGSPLRRIPTLPLP